MSQATTIIRWAAGCGITILGIEGARRAFRARAHQPERIALAAAVGLLGLTSLLGRLQEATNQRIPAITEIGLTAFVGSAYCLLLVRHAIVPMSRRLLRFAAAACVAAVTLVTSSNLPGTREPNALSAYQRFSVLLMLAVWTVCTGEAAIRFFILARHAPRLQRARARALALTFGGLAAFLDLGVLLRPRPNTGGADVFTFLILALIPSLWIAAMPPRWLRSAWRAREAAELRARVTAMLQMPYEELAREALACAVRAVGGDGGLISLPDGICFSQSLSHSELEGLHRHPVDQATLFRLHEHGGIVVSLPFEAGAGILAVRAGGLTPMFGEDERSVLEAFAHSLATALERTRLVEALRRETDRSRTMLDALGRMEQAIAVVEGTRVVYANEVIETITGYTVSELVAMPSFLEIVTPDERTVVAERLRRRLAGEEALGHYETTVRHKSGRTVHIEVSAQRLEGESPAQSLCIIRDVTERKLEAARDARRATELGRFSRVAQRLTGTLEEKALGASVAEAAREVIGAQRAAFVTYHDGDVELVYEAGLDEAELARAGVLRAADGYLGRLLAAGRPVRVAQLHRVARASGMPSVRAYSFLAIPVIRGTHMRAALFVAEKDGATSFDDIDESVASALANYATEAIGAARSFERERAAVERLRELDEMKNAFISALSHELRTPLTSVIGFAQTLEDDTLRITQDDRVAMLKRLTVNARRLERLLSDLLDVDRLRRGVTRPVLRRTDLTELALRVLEEFDLGAGRTINVEAEPVVIMADTAKVERILENLLANAMKHTSADVPVWVRIEAAEDGATITVEDAGEGIPAEMRAHIFEPFAQGPRVAKHSPGVGIGLSLVARFTELHGGRAWCDERPGGGASFKVYLPGAITTDDQATKNSRLRAALR